MYIYIYIYVVLKISISSPVDFLSLPPNKIGTDYIFQGRRILKVRDRILKNSRKPCYDNF